MQVRSNCSDLTGPGPPKGSSGTELGPLISVKYYNLARLVIYPPGNYHIPVFEKEIHVQKCLGRAYVSSQLSRFKGTLLIQSIWRLGEAFSTPRFVHSH